MIMTGAERYCAGKSVTHLFRRWESYFPRPLACWLPRVDIHISDGLAGTVLYSLVLELTSHSSDHYLLTDGAG